MIGIYCITNNINGMKYIGQSINIRKRTTEHKRELRNCVHHNDHLQKSWNKYGSANFKFEILEECKENTLTDRELYWIEYYNTMDKTKGYNIAIAGNAPMAGRNHTKESKQKMSEYRKVATVGDGNGFYGKTHTDETKDKISKHFKGRFVGSKNPMFGMTGDKNPMFGVIMSEESRQKMSDNHADVSGENHPKAKLTEDNVKTIITMLLDEIPMSEIAKMFNVKTPAINKIKNHTNWTHLTENIVFPSRKHRLAETTISHAC